MTSVHGAWLYLVCRVHNWIRHAGGVARQVDAHRQMQTEFNALLIRRPLLRRMLLAREFCVRDAPRVCSVVFAAALVLVCPGPLGFAS